MRRNVETITAIWKLKKITSLKIEVIKNPTIILKSWSEKRIINRDNIPIKYFTSIPRFNKKINGRMKIGNMRYLYFSRIG